MGMPEASSSEGAKRSLGPWSLAAALLSIAGFIMIIISTFTASGSALEPPDWLRVVTIPLFPLGAVAALILGIAALRRDSDRRWPVVALVLTAVVLIAFIVLIGSFDY